MSTIARSITTTFACLFGLSATAALAQNSVTYLSGKGNDTNNFSCSQASPCQSLGKALSLVISGGEVIVLDADFMGGAAITKSVTIRSEQAQSIVPGYGTRPIVISAGAGDQVILDGLDLDGYGPVDPGPDSSTGIDGIVILQAGEVVVRNCKVHGFTNSLGIGQGAGILVSSAKTRVTIENSFLAFNLYGILINTSGGQGHVKMFNTSLLSNTIAGVKVTAGNDILLAGNRIIGSPKSLDLSGGGAATSYGDNILTTGDKPTTMPRS
jgi:nitrous oxidase accessory protein NosD